METLTRILEKLGEHFARVGWMYGMPVYPRRLYHSRPGKDDR